MANRWFLYISELAQKAQQEVTRTPENWQKFLTTASRFYKSYDFDDQLLIYIQRPDAVACADIETWNNKMHRWVNAGSNAIGLIRKGTGGRPYIQNVHDVSDTHRVKGGKDPWLWRMEEAYHAPVMERLAKAFGIPEGGDLGECLMEAASKVSEEHYGEYLRDLHYEVEDSFLEGLDDHNIEVIFRDTIKASVQYAVLTRCGLDASLYIDADDLRGITNFNNVGTLACLGTATAEANRTILMEIGEAVKNIQLEQVRQAKKSLAKQPDVSYNKDEQFNTLKRERSGEDERIDIHQPERLSDSEHRDGQQEERTGNPDPVRQGEGEISDGTPESGLHGDAVERNPVGTSDGDRPGGEPAGRERDGGTGDERGRDGGTESSQSDGMGTADEQHPAESRGDRDGRPDLQLNTDTRTAGGEPAVLSSVEMDGPYSDASPTFTQMSLFPTVEEQIEQIAQSQAEASAPAFSVGMVPEQAVERILSAGTNEPAGALRIYAQYQAGAPAGEMAVSLRKEFGTGGRGFDFSESAVQTEPEKPDAPSSREKIILQAQELLDKQGLVVSEEYLNDAFEELGSETPKPEELADHTRSMLERDEAEAALEPEPAKRTVRDIYEQFQPVVLAQVLQDNAFANALENSDEENIKIECDAAIRRAVLAVDDVELTKAYFDVSAFHNRLHKEVLAQATEQAALTPKRLYEAALPELIGLIEQSEIYPFLRDRDTDVLDAQEELSAKLDELLSGLKDSRPALYEAYTTLPDFREYLIDDILERTYQDMVTDRRTSVEQHENDPDAPAWVTGKTEPEEPAETSGSTTLLPHVDAYNALKEKHPKELVGIQNGGYCLFYGEDARTAFEAVPVSWLLPVDLPGIGEVTVAGIREGWQEAADRLQTAGLPAVFFQDNGETYTALGRTLTLKEAGQESTLPQPERTDRETRAGAPSEEESPQPEPNLTPLTEEYLKIKAEYPGHVAGVRVDDLYLFYGKDAETAAKVLGSKIVTREIPGLGETAVTGSAASWQALGEKLLQHGNSALFAHPEGETYEVQKQKQEKKQEQDR